MHFARNTKKHTDFWRNRKIDWKTSYLDTVNHAHRRMIIHLLGSFRWLSLMEIGCGPAPNLVNVVKYFPGRQVGGVDPNPEAIALANKIFIGGFFRVGTAQDIPMSDDATDVILTDMCLIYTDPFKIDDTIKEIVRVARERVVFCEFHSDSLWARLKLRWNSGYHAHNYEKLLHKHGFYDIQLVKIPLEMWPGGEPQKSFGFIIIARVPKK